MKQPNTHRLSWATFDRGSGKHASGHCDFPSQADAELARAAQKLGDPDAVVTVAPIKARASSIKAQSQRIAPGHPEWQGERRMTR